MEDITNQALSGSVDISILLPVYNAEETLAACLASIVRQSITNWTCLIINDGSTDQSGRIMTQFAATDSRFRVIHCEHRGIVPALNEGLIHIHSEFTARMDADDLMRTHRLQEQMSHLRRHPLVAGVGSKVRIFPRKSMGQGLREYESWLNKTNEYHSILRDAFIECPIAHPTLFIRTHELKRFGYRETSWTEDYDLILRMLLAGKKIESVDKRLLAWRNGYQRLSKVDSRCSIEQFLKCKAHYLCEGFLKLHRDYILWGYGKTGRQLAKELERLGRHPKFIVDLHSGRVGNKILGVPVVAPSAIDELPRIPLIVCVAREGPRAEARRILRVIGREELVDFVCAA
ncbi:MAG: glycosyltransferase [Myxococcota bacterium]|nr:glycosyltransferase [Myxococcota bacterium]